MLSEIILVVGVTAFGDFPYLHPSNKKQPNGNLGM